MVIYCDHTSCIRHDCKYLLNFKRDMKPENKVPDVFGVIDSSDCFKHNKYIHYKKDLK